MTKKEKENFRNTVWDKIYYFNRFMSIGEKEKASNLMNEIMVLYELAPKMNYAFDFYMDNDNHIQKFEFNDFMISF